MAQSQQGVSSVGHKLHGKGTDGTPWNWAARGLPWYHTPRPMLTSSPPGPSSAPQPALMLANHADPAKAKTEMDNGHGQGA